MPLILLLRSLIRGTKLLNILLFCSPSLTKTVSENELSSSHMDSAVRLLYSGWRNRTMEMQKRARKEMRILPFMASSLVHLAGLQSIPCFRSLNAPST